MMQEQIQEEFQQKRVVLIGQTGHGKTTVFNKCCDKNLEVAAGGDSVTRNAFSTHTAYSDGFLMLDTPGIGALKEKLKHAVGIASAFAEGEINMVLIVVRYQRIDVIKQILYPMLKKQFKNFLNICTLAITHWDIVTQDIKNRDPNNLKAVEDKAKSQLDDLIKHFNINDYILISRQDKGDKICKDIELILKKGYPGLKCGLSTSEIQTYFDILEFTDELNDKLEESKEQVIKKFRKISSVVSTFITKFDMNDPRMPDVMHALCKEIKIIAMLIIEKFEQEHFETFSELENHIEDKSLVYLIDAQLKCELVNDINYVIKLAQEKMKNNPLHCFNFIRRCPRCKEVWMKVDGCNGKTFCGNFPQRDEQFFEQQKVIKKISFDITEKNIVMHYKDEEKEINQKTYSIGCYRYKEVGCRYECDWDDYQLLSKAELETLLDSGVLDFLADSITEEKFLKNKNLSTAIEQLRKQIKVQKI